MRTIVQSVCCGLLLGVLPPARAGDWPQWRGPERTGVIPEARWEPARLADGARVLWRTEVGQGYSAVSVRGGRLYTMGYRDGNDVVVCLDAATGRELWRHTYESTAGSYPGPRATPVLDENRVYTVGRDGQVYCLDSATGEVLWSRRLLTEHRADNTRWGISSSAWIEGDRLFLNVGQHGAALDKHTGRTLWSSRGTGGYATPVGYTVAGDERLALFSADAIHGLDAGSGAVLWSFPWQTSHDVNAADPIISDGQLFLSSGYNTGAALLDVSRDRPVERWRNRNMKNQFGTSVLIDGYLYGVDGNAGRRAGLACVAWDTGELQWREQLGFGALMAAGDLLILVLEGGDVLVAAADPAGFREVARASGVLSRTCWTMPVLAHGKLYLRNDRGELVCVDVRSHE